MIVFDRYQLNNGLTVILHHDSTTPMVVVNTLYDVGARDENEEKTGFAHLFEHLMFGGSINIPEFDTELQKAGGESNAFTSNDLTNYYDIVPSQNIETALWLESDRMLSLAFTEKSLEVQRNVVIEEFKQRYLNQPYGDVWLHLRPLAYENHPYKWATIGKDISHIENATMEDVKSFFKTFYTPSNAILCISGNFNKDFIRRQVENYFGDIPGNPKPKRPDFVEPHQEKYKSQVIYSDVPAGAFYYAFKMGPRKSKDYYLGDLMSDAIGKDNSSLLNIRLKKELDLVSEINAFITGSIDCGLFIISGKISEGIGFEELDKQLWKIVDEIKISGVGNQKLKALKNKIQTAKAFQEQGLLNRSINLSYFELLGDAEDMNKEEARYHEVKDEDLSLFAKKIFVKTNCSLLKVQKHDSEK